MQLPYFREVARPGVVCLHANASSSSQWRLLMDTLAPRFHVLAADSYGAGKVLAGPRIGRFGCAMRSHSLEPVFVRAENPLRWLRIPMVPQWAYRGGNAPRRVRVMALYEPTLFALLDAESPPPNAADGIRRVVAGAADALTSAIRPAQRSASSIIGWA